jgi:hypothetical protein
MCAVTENGQGDGLDESGGDEKRVERWRFRAKE